MNRLLREIPSGSMTLVYLENEEGCCGMTLLPTERRTDMRLLQMPFEPLVHLFLTGDTYPTGFSNGVSMRRSTTTCALRYQGQRIDADAGTVETLLSTDIGVSVHHYCRLCGEVIECSCMVENGSSEEIGVELLTSFALNTAVFGNVDNDAATLHRLRSTWSSENRLLSQSITQLNLEQSWAGTGLRTLRYGVTSTLSANSYAPFGALEHDGITWAALLEAPCSWQMEVSRYVNEELCLSGGMGDFEFAQFRQILPPGASLTTPAALLTAQAGDVEQCFRQLTRRLSQRMEYLPDSERELPIIYNEFCYTWGNPSADKIRAVAEKIQHWGIRYFVIDAGWYQSDGGNWENNMGDWIVSNRLFPSGMRQTVQELRSLGFLPGIWFELENIGEEAQAATDLRSWLLTRHGRTLQSGKRLFWNFSLPQVTEYLDRKVIDFLKSNGFSYIKIDYNESPGIGCDLSDSLGAGLRYNTALAQNYYRHLHAEIPELVLEVCASGGHRNEPSFLALSSMNSFSDAHECPSIPIIAANVGRIVPARQNQIWCVLQPTDDRRRMEYSLAATFLGRMCLSGDLCALAFWQDALVQQAIGFYNQIRPLIWDGDQYIHRQCGPSHEHPTGTQIIVRKNTTALLVVVHGFEAPVPMAIQVPEGAAVSARFGSAPLELKGQTVSYSPSAPWEAAALLLAI